MTALQEASVGGDHPELRAFDLFIDGRYVPARSGKRFDSQNPFTGTAWASIADGGAEDVDLAVRAALRAQQGAWGASTGVQRAALMFKLADIVEREVVPLAAIETSDNGKLRRDAESQVSLLPVWLRYFAGLADKMNGEAISEAHQDYFVYTRNEPVGVVGAVLPWNAPLILTMYKLAPALAAGCAFVAKPSEFTPASLLALAGLFVEAGFPAGVFNVVAGSSRETGAALVAHRGISRVAFTGSTTTGIAIAKSAAEHQAQVSLELGGKSPQLVFADANLDDVVNGVVAGVFAATGQMCHAGSRVYVEREIYSEFVERLTARSKQVRLGDPMSEYTEMGPVSTEPQFRRITELLAQAREQGATFTSGSQSPESTGYFVPPTVLTDVTANMNILREEVFGPVVIVTPFDTEDEAIELGNDTEYGLAAGLWTNDIRRVHRIAAKIAAGTVWVNCYRVASPAVPFGGTKASGVGRENGLHAILEYTEVKSVWIELSGKSRDPFRMG